MNIQLGSACYHLFKFFFFFFSSVIRKFRLYSLFSLFELSTTENFAQTIWSGLFSLTFWFLWMVKSIEMYEILSSIPQMYDSGFDFKEGEEKTRETLGTDKTTINFSCYSLATVYFIKKVSHFQGSNSCLWIPHRQFSSSTLMIFWCVWLFCCMIILLGFNSND